MKKKYGKPIENVLISHFPSIPRLPHPATQISAAHVSLDFSLGAESWGQSLRCKEWGGQSLGTVYWVSHCGGFCCYRERLSTQASSSCDMWAQYLQFSGSKAQAQ